MIAEHQFPNPVVGVDGLTLFVEADVSETTRIGWGSPRVVCATGGTGLPPIADQPHIVVISIDTVRPASTFVRKGSGQPPGRSPSSPAMNPTTESGMS